MRLPGEPMTVKSAPRVAPVTSGMSSLTGLMSAALAIPMTMGSRTATVPELETNPDMTPDSRMTTRMRPFSLWVSFMTFCDTLYARPVLKNAAPMTHMAMMRMTFELITSVKMSPTSMIPRK